METKECKTCHAIKPINEFHKHPQYADGHDSTCGACRSEQRKKKTEAEERTASESSPEDSPCLFES